VEDAPPIGDDDEELGEAGGGGGATPPRLVEQGARQGQQGHHRGLLLLKPGQRAEERMTDEAGRFDLKKKNCALGERNRGEEQVPDLCRLCTVHTQ